MALGVQPQSPIEGCCAPSGPSPVELEHLARSLIEGGRPDLLGMDPTAVQTSTLRGRPWARLAVAAALVAHDPRNPNALASIRAARRTFRTRGDQVGNGYASYVDGTRHLGLGQHHLAADCWREVRELLGDHGPVSANALAHLSLAAYHAGDPAEAASVADEAVGLARIRLDRRGEGRALVYRSLADLALGDLERCYAATLAADVTFSELTAPEDLFEWPLVPLGRIAVHGYRGQYEAAMAAADEASRRAALVGTLWYEGIALAVRAEFCAPADPGRAVADARRALQILRATGDRWWENTALRALGTATALAGHPAGARRLLEEAMHTSPSPFERARCALALAGVLVEAGELVAARQLLDGCLSMFRSAGSKVVLCQALRLLATIAPQQAIAYRTEARNVSTNDLAFLLLLGAGWPEATTQITVRCAEPGAIQIDGEEVTFMTANARRGLTILALHGEAGLHQEELSEHLWPGAPALRAGQRMRTLLWQMRKALGGEAWRLQRLGQVILLDPTNVAVDILATIAEAEALMDNPDPPATQSRQVDRVLARLEAPLLTQYQYEGWAATWRDSAGAAAVRLRSWRRSSDASNRVNPATPTLVRDPLTWALTPADTRT